MVTMVGRTLLGVVWTLGIALSASAANPVQWSIVEQVNRTDSTKTWNSPTAVDLGKMLWHYDFEITKVTGTVSVPFLGELTQDITGSLPPEALGGAGDTRDLPSVLLNEAIAEPTTGTSANVLVEVTNLGFGRMVLSNVVLGSVDLPLLGSRPIQRINIEASVDVIGYDFGDFNRDFVVDARDYVVWRDASGQTGPDLAADGNGDEVVNGIDYDLWASNFGRTNAGGSGTSFLAVVPEPSAGVMLIVGGLALSSRGNRRRRPLSPTRGREAAR